jgi:hypothetical protein
MIGGSLHHSIFLFIYKNNEILDLFTVEDDECMAEGFHLKQPISKYCVE